ncbi:MAG: MFS transporter [Firmicutes bacterium]|nr:MFS transporter [Bacillota bacterium]
MKKAYPLDFKTKFGFSFMGWMNTAGSSFMTSLFMIYLTDYSGIVNAAALGTVLLLIGRIIDAVDDPIQGFIMDNAKERKYGKYKPFIIISTVLTFLAIIALFCFPSFVGEKPLLITIWVILFYLLYDIGMSFYAQAPLLQSMSNDAEVRGKLIVFPRVFGMIAAIPMAFFLPMVTGLNQSLNNMQSSFRIMTVAILLPIFLLSMLGIALVKEGKHRTATEDEKLTFRDIITTLKQNKALLVCKASALFTGFVWTMLFAVTTYFVKWNYCADLATGAVDSALFGTYTTIMGMAQMLPMMAAAVISPWILKKFFRNDPLKYAIFSNLLTASVLGVMFVLYLLGLLNASMFFVLLFVAMFALGLGFVPGSLLDVESMDYGYWKLGKEVSGICNAVTNFLSKAQSALSSALVGLILILVGYQVNSVTDEYVGELSALPHMLNWFMVVMTVGPIVLYLIGTLILRKYPINSTIREEIKAELARRKEE